MEENRITYFAQTDARNKRVRFGIRAKDRTKHVYVIGKTGMGKSTMLENMAVQDIQNGEGMCFIDPHGKTADLMLEYVPKERIRDVIYIAPFDIEHPISFNVLESVDPDKRHLVSSGLMSTFKKIWEDAWSARMEYILTNTLLALLEYPGATLLGVNRMLSDKAYRTEVVNNIKDPSVKAFWQKEFANYTERQAAEAVPAIQNKVGQFTANPLIRNMIGQSQSSFDFREAIDHKKIVIINLSKGRIGDENMKLLGGLLVTKIYLAAMSRADVPDRTMQMLPNFYLYVDEFQNFANASFADILSEARKYKLNLTIAHQYIEQMDEIVRPAVFGNVGTMIAFRVGATDAELLEKEFAPQFVIEDLVNLGFAQIYLKLMIDGLSSAPFSATTLPPISHPDHSYVKEIIAASREQFSRPRAEVEEAVVKFHNPVVAAKTPAKAGSASVSTPSSATATPATSVASGSGSGASKSATSAPTPSAASASSVTTTTSNISTTTSTTASASKSTTVSTPASTLKVPTSISEKIPAVGAVHKPFADVLARVMGKSPEIKSEVRPTVMPPTSIATPSTPIAPKSVSVSPTLTSTPVPVSLAAKAPSPIIVHSEQKAVEPKPPVKLVPLANLAPKSHINHLHTPKVDPKVPTKQNVSDLKNALAAVLQKGNHVNPKPESRNSKQTQNPKSEIKKDTKSSFSVENTLSPRPYPLDPNPQEVPKDVLEKILNVD